MTLLLLFNNGAGPISGSLAVTLGALTVASDAQLRIEATAAITLGDLTATSQAALPIKATAAITLGDLTSLSSSTLAIKATAAITLGDLTLASNAALPIKATFAATLGTLTLVSTAVLPIKATLAATFGTLTMTATATLLIQATANITLGALTLAATNIRPFLDRYFSTGRFRTPIDISSVTAGKEEVVVKQEFYSPPKPSNHYSFAFPAHYSDPTEKVLPNPYSIKGFSMMADREGNDNWEQVVLFTSADSPIVVDPGVDDVGEYTHEHHGYVSFTHDLPPNCRCQIIYRESLPVGGQAPVCLKNRLGSLDGSIRSSTDFWLTQPGALAGSDGRFGGEMLVPSFGISAFDPEGLPIVFHLGDSKTWGKNENENILVDDFYGGMGFASRGLEDDTRSMRFPHYNMAVPSMGPAHSVTRKMALVARAPNRPYTVATTDHYNNLGGDYETNYKPSLQSHHAEIKAHSILWGGGEVPLYAVTPIPRPGSTDWCTSIENQGSSGGDVYPTGNRWLYDRDLRLGSIYTDIDGLIDVNLRIAHNQDIERDKLRLPGYVSTLALAFTSGAQDIYVVDRPPDDVEFVVISPGVSNQARHITSRTLQADGTFLLHLESVVSVSFSAGTVLKASFAGDSVGLHPNTPGHKLIAEDWIDWKNRVFPFVINAGGKSEADAKRARARRAAWERANRRDEAAWRAQKEREILEGLAIRFEKEGITLESLFGVDYHEIGLDDDEDVIEMLLLQG